MYRYIWLVPLLPLAGAAINGLLGRKFRFSEKLVGGIAVGSVALAFLLSVMAVWSYATDARWPKPYLTSEDGAYSYTWIPGGAVELTQGTRERAQIETDKLTEEKVREEAARQGAKPGDSVLVGVQQAPERTGIGAVLNVEWSYQLDP